MSAEAVVMKIQSRSARGVQSVVLGAAEVAGLPVGSIVWNGIALIVIPGGLLTQIALLPKRAGGMQPGGSPVADWGDKFILVSTGSGRLPTQGTAERKATAWFYGR